MKNISHFIFVFLVAILMSCSDEEEPVMTVTIKTIHVEPPVVALNGYAQLSCDLEFNGTGTVKDIEYYWTSHPGAVHSPHSSTTYWTPSDGDIGTCTIILRVTHNNIESYADAFIKVVNTPANGWGSLSGFVYDSDGNAIQKLDVTTVTGETSETKENGFFIISDVPQGITSLFFPGITYSWASSFPSSINVLNGGHLHLGNLILFESAAPKMLSTTVMPGKRMLIIWEPINTDVYQYIDIYQSDIKIKRVASSETNLLVVNSSTGSAQFNSKAIPVNGQISDFSNSVSGIFVNSIDPDPLYYNVSYSNFFSAALSWQGIDYENYLSGYRIAILGGSYWYFMTELLPVTSNDHEITTFPGYNEIFYVISIADDGSYNTSQSQTQRILINVPNLKSPDNFTGQYNSSETVNSLSWDVIQNNQDWYSGYLIKRAAGSDPTNESFSQVFNTSDMTVVAHDDNLIQLHTQYNYRLYAYALYPTTNDTAFSNYSEAVILIP
jgi:hypothetical protein